MASFFAHPQIAGDSNVIEEEAERARIPHLLTMQFPGSLRLLPSRQTVLLDHCV
jgi:hypothetical protein